MNKLLLSIITAPLYISFYTHCMTPPITKIEFQQYQKQCRAILKKDNMLFKQLRRKLAKNDLSEQSLIRQKIAFMNAIQYQKNNLFINIENLLSKIKQTYHINDCLWHILRKSVIEKHLYQMHIQQFPLANTYHDEAIPQNIKDFISINLRINKVNPNHINICNTRNSRFPHIFYNDHQHPITLYIDAEQFSQLHPHYQISLSCSVIESIFQNGQLLPLTLVQLEPLFNSTNQSIVLNPNYKELERLCKDTLTICLPCIDDPDLACYMLHFHHDCYYSGFTLKDYRLLSKINRYIKSIHLIRNYLNPPSVVEQASLSSSK